MSAGYTGEIKTGNVLYITVHNTGTSSTSSTDDSYGQLEIRALADAAAGESVQGVVLSYLVSAEIALDALARFKSSLLEPGDETLIYGGHITTGRISDSSGKNFIQLSAENGTPAGQMEFKDQTSWALSNQGIQWDSGNGQLNVKGHVQANSLTIIGNDGVAYNGTDAINISGYELTLEVVDIDGSYCYVYPHLLLNGEEVTGIVSASLPLDTINKIYYTRSGSAPHYDYTVVSDPVDSSVSSYYESTIDYSRFIWYRNNSSIGEVGDNTHEGRITAAYIDTLRCTYSFAEGGTGGAQSAVTVEVDPSRYITRNSATDINIHPESYQNTSSYIQLNNNGLHVFNSSGDSIANYGSITTIGKTDGSQSYLKLDYHSMQAIDKDGDYYFYVSDLRNADGVAEMSETMSSVYSSSTTITCYTTLIAYDWENEMEVYADGVLLTPVTGYTYNPSPTWREISIYKSVYPDVTRDSTIVVNYKTIDQQAKAYTIGLRDNTDTTGVMSIAMGLNTVASGYCSLAWGKDSKAFGKYSCALGERCKAWKMGSYAEGCATEAGYTAHAEGVNTRATGMYSHAQGSQSKATGQCAHAEGEYTQATGPRAHAEGGHTLASDADSHAGGWYSEASGDSAFAHGSYANAQGDQASAFGRYTLASSDNQFVIGKYNVEDTSSTYAFIIGKGTNTSSRSNAMQVDWNGKTTIASTLVQNSDRRLKDHIDYLDEDAVNFIRGLKPAHYIKDEENQLGFYAQDVEKIDTWNALIGEMNGYKTLSYTELIAPLVAYCQHLEKRIEELENK